MNLETLMLTGQPAESDLAELFAAGITTEREHVRFTPRRPIEHFVHPQTRIYMEKSALLSQCGLYRYELRRVWDKTASRCVFVMLNPSTADAIEDDPTIRKCIGFARRWGYGGFSVVNLFAFRTTYPKELFAAQKRGFDVVGPENDHYIRRAIDGAGFVVAAWGAVGGPTLRALEVAKWLPDETHTILPTSAGWPSHPLMLGYDLKPVKWRHPSLVAV